MNGSERRAYARVGIENLVWYSLLDRNDQTISQGMGRALNISRNGLLLETVHPIKSKSIALNTVDIDNNIIEIKGRIVYCRKVDSGVYRSAIGFVATEAEMDRFVVKLVRLHHHTSYESPGVTDAT